MAKKIADNWYECSCCKGHYTADGFYKKLDGVNGLTSICKGCQVKANTKSAKKNVKKYVGNYDKWILKRYGN